MEKVVLTALTSEGERVLLLLKSKVDIPLKDRFLYKRLYEEKILSEEPFSFSITPSRANRFIAQHVKNEDFAKLLEIELEKTGAKKDLDYTLEMN